jgi:CDP-6-deoxy-D-xylo-4-hexulose-3-dehydrase
VPVFVHNYPRTVNLLAVELKAAFRRGTTKVVMAAHALGNPFDLAAVLRFCRRHDLWLVEDNCDPLVGSYTMPRPLAEELGFHENGPGFDAGPDHMIHLGRPQHPELLPAPPPHHGRGRCRKRGGQRPAEPDR